MNENRYYTGNICEVKEVKFVLDHNGAFNYQRKEAINSVIIKENALLLAYEDLPGTFFIVLEDGKISEELITTYPEFEGVKYVERSTIKKVDVVEKLKIVPSQIQEAYVFKKGK